MNLEALQRAMAAAVMQPLAADAQMQELAPDGRRMAVVAESFIAPNSRLTAFERLEIYNRQYWFRLLGALAEDFPALQAVVGERRFEALSIAYLSAHPSRSFSLRNLGSRLVEWLTVHPQQAGRRSRLARDVARIEWAFIEAYDSLAWTPLTLDQIAVLDAGSRLALQPHLQLVALDYPADALVLALHEREKRHAGEAGARRDDIPVVAAPLPKIRLSPTWLAVHRFELAVYFHRLQREEFLTLAAMRRGLPLSEALEAGFQASRIPQPRRPQCVRAWFAHWAELGWLHAPDSSSLTLT